MLDRLAGEVFLTHGKGDEIKNLDTLDSMENYHLLQQRPVVPGFNSEDLSPSPEITPGNRPFFMPGKAHPMDLLKDKYIREYPESGVSLLPNGEQGPAQGPNIPIKNYGGVYMPDGTQPTGYRPGPMAQLVPNMVERAIDNYTSDPDDAVMDDIAYPMRVRPIEFDMNLIRKKNPRSFMPQV